VESAGEGGAEVGKGKGKGKGDAMTITDPTKDDDREVGRIKTALAAQRVAEWAATAKIRHFSKRIDIIDKAWDGVGPWVA
jgi:hypothetical protein